MVMKVAYLDHTIDMGGGEVYLLDLLKFLDRDRFSPIVILPCLGPLSAYLQELSVPVEVISTNQRVIRLGKHDGARGILRNAVGSAGLISIISGIGNYLRTEGVSLVHTNSIKANLYGSLAAKLASKPVIWHLHDILTADSFSPCFSRLLTAWASIFNDAVICNSIATREAFIACGGQPGKAVTIHNGIDLSKFDPTNYPSTDFREELGLPKDIPLIGHIGRLAPWKGQHILIKAATYILAAAPEAHFVLVGEAIFGNIDEDYRRSLETQIAKLGLSSKVRLVGFRQDIPRIIAALDVVAHSSVAPEPFGLVLAEAMAMGKPVVAAKGGGSTEVVKDSVTGFLVEPGNPTALAKAVLAVLKNKKRAVAIGRAGRRYVERFFTIERNLQQVEEVYSKVLGN